MEGQDPELIRLSLLANPGIMAQIRAQQPELARAAESDPRRFAELLRAMPATDGYDRQRARQQQINALNEDPFDVEAQRKIEDMIQQEQILENLNNAMEYHPESFARVTMLYIDVEVNGHQVKAFVDSGAQATIMSPQCAEACGIMRLVDKRYAGTAVGVGTAHILGRVHSAQIKLGALYLPCSLTVMEGGAAGRAGPDMLFGLDMLKRHQACIDLASNTLRIGDASVPFLGEHALPASAREDAGETQRTVSGPGGAQVNESGAVIPPPAASAQPGVVDEEKVGQLQAMGFDRAECVQALEATQGNVEMAAGLLL